MNDLNSVLIEGEVVEHMMVGEDSRWLKIRSRRYVVGDGGALELRYTELNAVLHGKVAERLAECRPGRVVRMVGSLAQFDNLVMEVDHVEIRPVNSRKPEGESGGENEES